MKKDHFYLFLEVFRLPPTSPEMKYILKNKLGNAFDLWTPLPSEHLAFIKENPSYALSIYLPGETDFLDDLKRHAPPGKDIVPTVQFALDELAKLQTLAEETGVEVYWNLFPECDSCRLPVYLYENNIHYKNRREAYEKIKEYFSNWDIVKAVDGKFNRCKRMGVAGCPSYIGMLCELGLNVCFTETCISSLFDMHPTIALTRGLTRQYGKKWGIDVSHWTTYAGPTIYNADGSRHSGWSESYLERNLYIQFFAGAEYLRLEEMVAAHETTSTHGAGKNYALIKKEDGTVKPTPFGEALQRFAAMALDPEFERGETCIPIAFLMDKYCGWNPKRDFYTHNTVWKDQFLYNDGDYMFDHLADIIYEGHHRHGSFENSPFVIKRRYENSHWQFKEKNKAVDIAGKVLEAGFDTRPFESISNAVYGDSFDYINTDSSLENLKRYNLIIPLGKLKFSKKLKENLMTYVREGGTVLLTGVESAQFESSFTGMEIDKKNLKRSNTSKCLLCSRAFDRFFNYETGNDKEVHYEYPASRLLTAVPCAANREGDVIVACNDFGKGKVYVSGPLYAHGVIPTQRVRIVEHFIRHLFDEFVPVKVDPEGLSYIFNQTSGGYTMLLLNNEAIPCRNISLTIRNHAEKKINKVTSYITKSQTSFTCKKDNIIISNLNFEPFSYQILELKEES